MQFESAEEQEAFLSKADHLHKWSGEYQYENLLLDVLQNGVVPTFSRHYGGCGHLRSRCGHAAVTRDRNTQI